MAMSLLAGETAKIIDFELEIYLHQRTWGGYGGEGIGRMKMEMEEGKM